MTKFRQPPRTRRRRAKKAVGRPTEPSPVEARSRVLSSKALRRKVGPDGLTFVDRLESLRQTDENDQQFADRCGVARTTLIGWLHGTSRIASGLPRYEHLRAISENCGGASIDWLVFGEGPEIRGMLREKIACDSEVAAYLKAKVLAIGQARRAPWVSHLHRATVDGSRMLAASEAKFLEALGIAWGASFRQPSEGQSATPRMRDQATIATARALGISEALARALNDEQRSRSRPNPESWFWYCLEDFGVYETPSLEGLGLSTKGFERAYKIERAHKRRDSV